MGFNSGLKGLKVGSINLSACYGSKTPQIFVLHDSLIPTVFELDLAYQTIDNKK
jgi:hypothetical protein